METSPRPWKAVENSWQYTTIYDAHDREICRLDLERFEDLNEETQDKYEAIQRADVAAIVLACDHDAALRRAKAEGMRMASKMADEYGAEEWSNTCVQDGMARLSLRLDARAAQIEEGK